MKHYRLFEVTDFVTDEDFIRWVYEKNTADERFWKQWLAENPDKHLIVSEAAHILKLLSVTEKKLSKETIEYEVGKVLSSIRQPAAGQPVAQLSTSRKWWWAAAALILLITGATLYYTIGDRTNASFPITYAGMVEPSQMTGHVNASEQSMLVRLPDGSNVELSPGSRISYHHHLDTMLTRDVYLYGEAFFEVTKNPARPFRVFTEEVVTKVLGTSFSVRSFGNDKNVLVTVRTGKVSVYNRNNETEKETAKPAQSGGTLLMPNQQVIYKKDQKAFEKQLLEKPVIIAADMNVDAMQYEDVPVVAVLQQIEKAFGIDMIYEEEQLKKCTITADLRDESLYQKLSLLCEAIGATYEVIDAQVVIQSNGCK